MSEVGKAHCWHDVFRHDPSYDPENNFQQICCWCGVKRSGYAVLLRGHGPHVKPHYGTRWVYPDGAHPDVCKEGT